MTDSIGRQKLRVAVWMGGSTREREVSLITGGAVAGALRERGHEVLEFDLEDEGEAFELLVASQGADVVFVALHGGRGEDGTVQALLELAGMAYVGSRPGPCAVAMDKLWSKQIARQLGVLTADWVEVTGLDDGALYRRAEEFGFPLVLKPVDEGSAVGVLLADDASELSRQMAEFGSRRGRWMLERYIAGRELTVAVVEDQVLPLVEIRPLDGFYDYRHKYTAGCTEYDCPAAVDPAVAARIAGAADEIYRGLHLRDMARIDFRLDERGEAFFLEANTIPGMTGTSLLPKAAAEVGMEFPQLCERLCTAALRRRTSG